MMRQTFALIRAFVIEIRRSKTALFWMTAFPIGFLLLFGFVMARSDPRGSVFLNEIWLERMSSRKSRASCLSPACSR